jgi:hypothetical protein
MKKITAEIWKTFISFNFFYQKRDLEIANGTRIMWQNLLMLEFISPKVLKTVLIK